MHPKELSIKDFTYQLPPQRIALHPLSERDASKLLVYKNEEILSSLYKNIDQFIPENSLLVFNDSKVIRARIYMQRKTGGGIEIFLLEPWQQDYAQSLSSTRSTKWKCLVGGAVKWKEGSMRKELTVNNRPVILEVEMTERRVDAFIISFSWNDPVVHFAGILEVVGVTPLPPYIKRKTEAEDSERYQTIYANIEGSVAAPTAGLHFTEDVFRKLKARNIHKAFVSLHVGAGTFKPVKAEQMNGHEMHSEWMDISLTALKEMIPLLDQDIIAVGTTSLRTLESLYWMGVKTMLDPAIEKLSMTQWEIYDEPLVNYQGTVKESFASLVRYLEIRNSDHLYVPTQLLILPGYIIRVANAIITNFHQPQSTLLLLVAAAIGDDWRRVYQYALDNEYRFLSYGDGSILQIRNKE